MAGRHACTLHRKEILTVKVNRWGRLNFRKIFVNSSKWKSEWRWNLGVCFEKTCFSSHINNNCFVQNPIISQCLDIRTILR